jgi:hypothetical protein
MERLIDSETQLSTMVEDNYDNNTTTTIHYNFQF